MYDPNAGAMPPDLMSMMGGGEAPPEAPPEESAGSEDTLTILQRMIEDAQAYIDAEKDPEDRATMSKVLQTLLQYQADEQKEKDSALGTSPAMKHMRRNSGQRSQ